jgi:hypothetical protein
MTHTRRFTYVRSAKVRNHLRRYDNLPGDKTQLKAFYTKNEKGEYELDRKKLKEAFSKVAVKGELSKQEVTYWADGWAPEFVEAFNAKYDAKAAKDKAEKDTPDEALPTNVGRRSLSALFRRCRSHHQLRSLD